MQKFARDYNEASYLNPFWANYSPDYRGRAHVGDQVPWIEVGEHAVGHKLNRLIAAKYKKAEVGLPFGAVENDGVLNHIQDYFSDFDADRGYYSLSEKAVTGQKQS